jgi:hypothetical protein
VAPKRLLTLWSSTIGTERKRTERGATA